MMKLIKKYGKQRKHYQITKIRDNNDFNFYQLLIKFISTSYQIYIMIIIIQKKKVRQRKKESERISLLK